MLVETKYWVWNTEAYCLIRDVEYFNLSSSVNILLSKPRFPRHENVSVITGFLPQCQFPVQLSTDSTVICSLLKKFVFQYSFICSCALYLKPCCTVYCSQKSFERFSSFMWLFHSQIPKKWSRYDKFHDHVISESPAVEVVASQFVCKFVEFRTLKQDAIQDMLQRWLRTMQSPLLWQDSPWSCYFCGICHARLWCKLY